jgi:hypothetical protein
MNKRTLNETAFSIQGINPGFTARDETNHIPPQTPGKVVLKRLIYYSSNKKPEIFSLI